MWMQEWAVIYFPASAQVTDTQLQELQKKAAQLAATKVASIKLFPEIHEEPRTAHNADRKIHNVTAKQD